MHITCATLSISGFMLRSYWRVNGNALLHTRLVKIAPHIIDSALLASAVGMLVIWQLSPLEASWLLAKIIALMLYIVFGIVAFRFAQSRASRLGASVLALLCAFYIVAVAFTKNPLVFM